MRQYRHHDDNIFTVQFATPCNDMLTADITPPGNELEKKEVGGENSSATATNINTPLMGDGGSGGKENSAFAGTTTRNGSATMKH